jgi:SAM-dependent methyltransferase
MAPEDSRVALPFSEACERNKEPILMALRQWLEEDGRVLEVGSGTGQHAVHMSRHLRVVWQPSDRAINLGDLHRRCQLEGQAKGSLGWLLPPVELDVLQPLWPEGPFDAVFSANTAHIMPWSAVPRLLEGSAQVLKGAGLLLLYGPFHDGGRHTSPSNAAFDQHLRSLDPAMGVRDVLEITDLAASCGLQAIDDLPMPANNRLLVFRREPAAGAEPQP